MNATPTVGMKLVDKESGVEVIVVRAPSNASLVLQLGAGDALLGKRYVCTTCDAEVLVSKAGRGGPSCHGTPMTIGQPKTLPSAD